MPGSRTIFWILLGQVLLACNVYSVTYECTFESGLCTFTQLRPGSGPSSWGQDEFDWTFGRGPTPDFGTGPNADHTLDTGSGSYMYIESSPPQGRGQRASLVSQAFTINSQPACLRFWYHMNGPDIGLLRVYAVNQNARRDVWSLSGAQGNIWNLASVTLNIGTERFIVEATVGGRLGDIAIDDFRIRDGPCDGVPLGCPDQQCQNGGRCIFQNNVYCQCPPLHEGTYCETQRTVCRTNPCVNGGTCYLTQSGNEKCSCRLGYYGNRCEMGRSESCKSQPCLNGGHCLENLRTLSFWCVCPQGYTGKHCHKRRYVTVLPVRLVGGSATEGRLEVFNDKQWGTVCSDGFNILAAQTVCRQLGFIGRAVPLTNLEYGRGSGNIWLDGVHCDYSYDALNYCCHNEIAVTDCDHNEDVGVRCFDDSMLPLGDFDDFRDGSGFNVPSTTVTNSPTVTSDWPNGSPYLERLVACTFEDQCPMTQAGNDDYDWLKYAGSTTSYQTGPSADHTTGTGQYMYVEASGRKPGSKAILRSPTLPANDPKCLAFWYHMYGKRDMGTLNVYIQQAQQREKVWSRTGDQGDRWDQAIIDIGTAYNLVEIEAVRGSGYKSDIAIDDLIIIRGLCRDFTGFPNGNSTRPRPVRTPAPTRPTPPPTTPRPTPSPTTPRPTPSPTTTRPTPSPTTPRPTPPPSTPRPTPSPSTTRPTPPPTTPRPTPSPTTPRPTPSTSTPRPTPPPTTPRPTPSPTTPRPTPPSTTSSLTESPIPGSVAQFDCSLDFGSCRYLIQAQDDNFDWQYNRGGTPSGDTGPPADHTLGTPDGYYLYTEATSPRAEGQRAVLNTPLVVGSNIKCFSMWYNMNGLGMGTLNVYKRTSGTDSTELIWTQSGHQGIRWINVKLTLIGTPFYVIIESIRGNSFASDMAIDDIEVTDGPCFDFTREQVCTFDDTTCFMYQVPQDDFNWLMTNGKTMSDSTGPDRGVGVTGGYYLYVEASYQNRGDRALLRTPVLSSANFRCLSFYYHMYGDSMGSLNVYRATSFGDARLFNIDGNQGNEWRYQEVQIDDTDGLLYSIVIEGVMGSAYRSDIALDNIRLKPGIC